MLTKAIAAALRLDGVEARHVRFDEQGSGNVLRETRHPLTLPIRHRICGLPHLVCRVAGRGLEELPLLHAECRPLVVCCINVRGRI